MTDRKNQVSVVLQDIFNEVERRTHMWVNTRQDLDVDAYTISRQDVDQIISWAMEGAAQLADKTGYMKHHYQTGLDGLTFFKEWEKKEVIPDYLVLSNITLTNLYNGQTISGTIEDSEGNSVASFVAKELQVVKLDNQTISTENGIYRVGLVYAQTIKYEEVTEGESETYTNDPDGRKIFLTEIIEREYAEGEKLPKRDQNTIVFNVTDAVEVNRYTIIQQYIKSALQAYILTQWWSLKGIGDQAALENQNFEKHLQNVRFNSVANHRIKNSVRRPNYY